MAKQNGKAGEPVGPESEDGAHVLSMINATLVVGALVREAVKVAESVDRAGARALTSLGMSLRLLGVKFGDIEELPTEEMKRLLSEIGPTRFRGMILSWRAWKLAALRGDELRAALTAVQEVGRLHRHVCRGQPPIVVGRVPAFSAAHALSMICQWLLGRAEDAATAHDDLARAWISIAEVLHEEKVASQLRIRLVNEASLVRDLPKKRVLRLLGKSDNAGTVDGRSGPVRVPRPGKLSRPLLHVEQLPAKVLVTLLNGGGRIVKRDLHLMHTGPGAKPNNRLANLLAPSGELTKNGFVIQRAQIISLTATGRREATLQKECGTKQIGS